MMDGAITTPDTVLVRLGARVVLLMPDARPGWWRIDPATCVRRADAIEIRAAALAAAANGGGARLLAVLRAATLDGAATPLADAVMLALALGDTENPPPSSLPGDGWTRVRFGDAEESTLAEGPGEDIAGLIEALLARVASHAADAVGDLLAPELRSATVASPSAWFDPTQDRQRAGRSPAPEDRNVAFAGKPLPVVQTGLADPRLRNPAQPEVLAAHMPTLHATLRHRRLVAKPAHPKSAHNDHAHPDTTPVPPPALREPAGSKMTAAPVQTIQPTISFPAIFSSLPAADLATRPKLAPTFPELEDAAADGAPPLSSTASPSFFTAPRSGKRSAPLAGRGSPGLDAWPPALSWPGQAAPGPAPGPALASAAVAGAALPDADALLSAFARALADECDHRGLDR
jgi:hypothetical protein